jgi:multiple sugar transport system substrate-binding protein
MKFRTFLGATALLALTGASAPAADKDAADVAVEAAKKYAGTTISIVWEAGLQSLDPLNYSGAKWEQLTGIKVKVVEVPTDQMFTKIVQDFKSGAGAYDALNVIPSWMPDLARSSRSTNMSTNMAIATNCRTSPPLIAITKCNMMARSTASRTTATS